MKIGRDIAEIGAVIVTALLHPVFVDLLDQRALFILAALGGWVFYLARRVAQEKGVLQHWGFRKDGLAPAFLAASVFAAAALAVMTGIALARHTLVFRWPMSVLLGLYPVWGMFQQLLVQGVFVRTVTASGGGVWTKLLATAVAALLFGAVHLPDVGLAAATCLLGCVFTVVYLKWRTLWPLGLWHGWLGVFYYYWVLGRDPWADIFATWHY